MHAHVRIICLISNFIFYYTPRKYKPRSIDSLPRSVMTQSSYKNYCYSYTLEKKPSLPPSSIVSWSRSLKKAVVVSKCPPNYRALHMVSCSGLCQDLSAKGVATYVLSILNSCKLSCLAFVHINQIQLYDLHCIAYYKLSGHAFCRVDQRSDSSLIYMYYEKLDHMPSSCLVLMVHIIMVKGLMVHIIMVKGCQYTAQSMDRS